MNEKFRQLSWQLSWQLRQPYLWQLSRQLLATDIRQVFEINNDNEIFLRQLFLMRQKVALPPL